MVTNLLCVWPLIICFPFLLQFLEVLPLVRVCGKFVGQPCEFTFLEVNAYLLRYHENVLKIDLLKHLRLLSFLFQSLILHLLVVLISRN